MHTRTRARALAAACCVLSVLTGCSGKAPTVNPPAPAATDTLSAPANAASSAADTANEAIQQQQEQLEGLEPTP